jgi:DegV family protein with EDD domain
LIRSGRVSRLAGWLGTRLNVKPILTLTPEGLVDSAGRARGREAAKAKVLALLDRALAAKPKSLRLGVVHAGIHQFADTLRQELVRRYAPKEALVSPITPVLATHTGIGTWGVFYQVEDGTNDGGRRYE